MTATPSLVSGDGGPALNLPDLKNAPAIFRRFVQMCGRNWAIGSMAFVLPSGREIRIQGAEPGPSGQLIIHDYRFVRRTIAGGDIGFAEGYMAGEWDSPDLSALLEVLTRNIDKIRGLAEGGSFLVKLANRISHALNANSRFGSKRNIHAHYDLGNSFYERWLDPSMTYSSAYYETPDQPLEGAQRRKYETLAHGIGLTPSQHVREIGCGWGGFAEFAATEVGAKVTGITISQAQFDYAKKRMFEQGLSEKADIQLIDYRDVRGVFDKVASIEMFEAVGERYWPTYFGKIRDVLKPGGQAGLQIITIKDEIFERYRRRADFIQKYIFPGGMLPSETRLKAETDRAGLGWQGVVRFGQHYADTLAEWGRRFDGVFDELRGQGFDERFRRLWRFYLSYCEAGFRTERTNVIQLSLAKT
jgi:cyclopropane-fatty-acyl-phospholipid synthase